MICMDLVDPFTIRIPTKTHSLLLLTMMDQATGWFEIFIGTNKSETSIQDLFHNTWLACYPWPQFIVFDNGGKFKREFKKMCKQDNYGIKAKPITSHNRQTTSKCDHWASIPSSLLPMIFSDHLTLKIVIKILRNRKIIYLITSFNQLYGYHAIRSTYHTTLQATPCQLVFGRDMIHNIAFRVNWDHIQKWNRTWQVSSIKNNTRTIVQFLINE
jgi:hypothetical protein